MIDLFGEAGRVALERLAARRAVYGFDFDGTLAPIVSRPDDAIADTAVLERLEALGRLAPIAILTGRGVADVRRRVAGTTRAHLIGNHGAEGLPSAPLGRPDHAALARDWLRQWPAAIGFHSDDPGILIEDKDYSLSIHYRHARDPLAAARAAEAAIAALVPAPRVIGGKFVFNLMPPDAPDKGQALRALLEHQGCEAAFYIGDDLTDESVFDGAPADWVTVRVGRSDATAARYCIESQDDIGRCLELLIDSFAVTDRNNRQEF